MELSHSRYSKLKRLTNTQQGEKDIIELGMLSIMQMHYNETGTEVANNWKHTFTDIYTLYHEELKNLYKLIDSGMIHTSQEQKNAPAPTKANADTTKDSFFYDSDDDDSHTSEHTKRYSLYDDEEDDDDPETENPLDKGSGHEKNDDIDSHDIEGEMAILFCWQFVLLYVLPALVTFCQFVWGRTFW